ncbi:acyl-CoA dehydrogenase family protein [Streptomyces sp. CSDS2]|uniref:acyl-CoA dehydrogenase family protein n=1 Tax=Streptomyces sp. CSDS2 TaxID=3055051 RepID=UPI0025B172EB|nr:acyl-CoA dehydrogenase family protein [Streptomyces sp. CSDS2]MDN3260246.1 acyl-CoA dehydrogenase family protein [Streptomyces sp. CSDS2]
MTAREMPEQGTPARTPRPGFATGLFLGRPETDPLAGPAGDPRRPDPAEERFLARLRDFCEKEVDSAAIERADRVPDEVVEGLKDIGALAIRLPRRYGGLGLSTHCYLRALMLTSTTHPALSELLAAHQAIGLIQPLLLFGTDEQKRAFLPRCVREISAFALTEADIGNDPFRMHTTAVYDPASDRYVLDGVKTWTTNGVIADLLVVMAVVPAGEHGEGGMTAFVVEADAPGVTVERRNSFLGLRGLENGCVRLHRVAVPAGNRIGAEGEGLAIALAAQDTGRLSLPAVSAAAAKWSLKVARQWSAARVQFGRPIARHDAIAGKVSFIAATAFALEALVEVIARRAAAGDTDTRLDAELAKLFASERAWVIADELVQLRGGRGYETAESAIARGERGVPVEQLLRDVRVGRIFDGSSEALRAFLAHDLLEAHRAAAGEQEATPCQETAQAGKKPGAEETGGSVVPAATRKATGTGETAQAEEAAHAKETAQAEEAAWIEESARAGQAAEAQETTTAGKAAPARATSPTEGTTRTGDIAPAGVAAPVGDTASPGDTARTGDTAVARQTAGPGMSVGPVPSAVRHGGVLDDHLEFVARTSRRIAGELAAVAAESGPDGDGLDGRQRFLGRIVDIGAELYAMSASCAYARALGGADGSPAELADAFCRQARLRVAESLARLGENTDAADRAVTGHVLDGRYTWLEEGVVDVSVDGPWIAEQRPGPSTGPSLRRVIRPAGTPESLRPSDETTRRTR